MTECCDVDVAVFGHQRCHRGIIRAEPSYLADWCPPQCRDQHLVLPQLHVPTAADQQPEPVTAHA